MRSLRIAIVEGHAVQAGHPYLMIAVPVPIPLKPGELPEIGKPRPMNMTMVPGRLEWFDDETQTVEIVGFEAAKRIIAKT